MASSEAYQKQLKSTSQNLERLLASVRVTPPKRQFVIKPKEKEKT